MTDDTKTLVALFKLDGEPASKARARFATQGGKTRAYTPPKTREAEQAVAWSFRAAAPRHQPTDAETAYRVEMHFRNGTRQRRDVDNMVKLILDGLNGIAWPDDNQVIEIEAKKSYVPKAEACTEVAVFTVGSLEPPKQPCLRCGKEFRTYESWRNNTNGKKYCSSECGYKHRVERRARTCKQCGETYHAHGESHDTKYCSRDCKSKGGRVTIPCSFCGTEFSQVKSWAVRGRTYCSTDCTKARAAQRARERRTKVFPGTCQVCGGGTTKKQYKTCAGCIRGSKPA